jgi:4-hydroxybenzoate polyprenyltransferase
VYDTIYAYQDIKDDEKAGVKSTALLFGKYGRVILIVFAIAFIVSLIAVGILNEQRFAYYIISCGGTMAHLIWQFITWKMDDPVDCAAKFKASETLDPYIFF